MRYIVISGLPGYTFFLHYLINSTIVEKVTENYMFILIFSTNIACNNSHYKKN